MSRRIRERARSRATFGISVAVSITVAMLVACLQPSRLWGECRRGPPPLRWHHRRLLLRKAGRAHRCADLADGHADSGHAATDWERAGLEARVTFDAVSGSEFT